MRLMLGRSIIAVILTGLLQRHAAGAVCSAHAGEPKKEAALRKSHLYKTKRLIEHTPYDRTPTIRTIESLFRKSRQLDRNTQKEIFARLYDLLDQKMVDHHVGKASDAVAPGADERSVEINELLSSAHDDVDLRLGLHGVERRLVKRMPLRDAQKLIRLVRKGASRRNIEWDFALTWLDRVKARNEDVEVNELVRLLFRRIDVYRKSQLGKTRRLVHRTLYEKGLADENLERVFRKARQLDRNTRNDIFARIQDLFDHEMVDHHSAKIPAGLGVKPRDDLGWMSPFLSATIADIEHRLLITHETQRRILKGRPHKEAQKLIKITREKSSEQGIGWDLALLWLDRVLTDYPKAPVEELAQLIPLKMDLYYRVFLDQ